MMRKLGVLSALGMMSLLNAAEVRSVPGELIVKFRPGRMKSFVAQFASQGFSVDHKIGKINDNLHVVKFDESKSFANVLSQLNSNPAIEYAEPNYIYDIQMIRPEYIFKKPVEPTAWVEEILSAPNDPKFGQLWGLKNTGSNEPKGSVGVEGADINAIRAWEITKGSKQVKIAVIDTGIDYTHPDLAANIWTNEAEANGKTGVDDDGNGYVDDIHGYDFANGDADPIDGHSHGTHCAGTIGAIHDNETGVAGVMADVTLVPVKFLTDEGSGTTEAAIQAIDYATKLNVDIMSNSWGGGGRSQALEDAIKRASDSGIIFVAAAGNNASNNDSSMTYPANYEVSNVVSVAAHTAQNDLAYFSNYGRSRVHIAAPGHNILSSVKGGKYDVYSGTSMATPHVSGVLGLLISKEGRLAHSDLRDRVMKTSVPVGALRGKTITGGRIDAYNLLTDTRPERKEPNPNAWVTMTLPEKWESTHPYADGSTDMRAYTFEGAKYIRVKVKKLDLESGYDFIKVADKNDVVVQKMTGSLTEFVSDFVEGDSIKLTFQADRSVSKWGFLIEQVEVQY